VDCDDVILCSGEGCRGDTRAEDAANDRHSFTLSIARTLVASPSYELLHHPSRSRASYSPHSGSIRRSVSPKPPATASTLVPPRLSTNMYNPPLLAPADPALRHFLNTVLVASTAVDRVLLQTEESDQPRPTPRKPSNNAKKRTAYHARCISARCIESPDLD